MIWLVLYLLAESQKPKGSSSSSRPLPVLMRGASGRLWHVRELGGGYVELSDELDQVVATYLESGGVRKLRSHPPAVAQLALDAAILDFKIRTPRADE